MIEHLRLDRLTKAESRRYEDGDWLEPPVVKSEVLEHLRLGPDLGEDAAAEMAARIRIAIEEGHLS